MWSFMWRRDHSDIWFLLGTKAVRVGLAPFTAISDNLACRLGVL